MNTIPALRLRELAAVAVLLVAPLACAHATAAPPAQNPPANPDAVLQKEFMDKVSEYDALRKKIEGTLPALPAHADADQLHQHQQALLRALQRARRNAEPGDLFHKHTRALIRRNIAQALAQDTGHSKRAIEDENPVAMVSQIVVNSPYPHGVAVTTVPPQVLDALPRLPVKDLEYRFVGRRLVLLDTRANMVVDYVDDALPR